MIDEANDFDYLIKKSNLKSIKFVKWDEMYDVVETAVNKYGGGIYRMYDANKEIIYVGKSNDIHRRLLQHIGKRSNTAYFIDEVVRIEFYRNDDPVLQTMLEGIFIAYHAPRYNDEVKDRMK